MKIDEKVYIPLHWFLVSLSSVIISVAVGSFWVKSVDDRLSIIEKHLGIPPLSAGTYESAANAGEKK